MTRHNISRSLRYRADQSGLLLSGANIPLTFQRTLIDRPTIDQALVTGLSIAVNHTLVAMIQESIQGVALVASGGKSTSAVDRRRWSRVAIAGDVVAFGAGIALQRWFRQKRREPLPQAAVRTGGFWLSMTGAVGGVIGALQEVQWTVRGESATLVPVVVPAAGLFAAALEFHRRRLEKLDTDLPPSAVDVSAVKAIGLGLAVAGTASAVGLGERWLADGVSRGAAHVVPANPELLRVLGHAVALAGIAFGTKALIEQVFARLEAGEGALEQAFDIPPANPLVSGSLGSDVDFGSLSKQGRRYCWTVYSPEKIREVVGESDVKAPIRVYVGLAGADTEEARVALVLAELERTGAFERKYLLVDSPTGTGYVNYAAVGALELLTRGDCASAAMQYAARPSVLSLDRVSEGRGQARLLLDALHARLQEIPEDRRPKLVLFGESLGAWTSQDPFVDRGTEGLVDTGIDHAIWIGTPHFSKWKEQVLFDDRSDVDRSLVGVFNDIGEWHATPAEERAKIRYVMITHHNDGVALFGPELAIQAPEWLGPSETRPSSVPKAMRWMPSTTFLQVLVDMKNSATVIPGQFAAKGHDYRADLVPFFQQVLGLPATPEQLVAISDCLQQEELDRSEWIKAHGQAGKSLAAAIIDARIAAAVADGQDPNVALSELVHGVADDQFGAGGGAHVPDAHKNENTTSG